MAHDTDYRDTGKASDVDSAASPDHGFTAVSVHSGVVRMPMAQHTALGSCTYMPFYTCYITPGIV